jgi:hypothetical protein
MGGRVWPWAIALAVLASHAANVRADDGAGAFRFGLGADVFDWHTQDWARATGSRSHREGFDLVLVAPRFEVQLAGQVIPEVALGVLLAAGWGSQSETGRTDLSVFSYMLQALVEVLPWQHEVARPFLRGTLGVAGAERDHADGTLAHYSVVLFDLSATVGVHLFANRSLSVSPFARVHYATGPGTEIPMSGPATSLTTNYVAISAGAELIGWIGGTPSAPAAAAPSVEPEAARPPDAALPTFRDGVLRSRVRLSDGIPGSISAEPARDASEVEIRFALPDTQSELESCDTVEVVDGETRTSIAFRVARLTRGSRVRLVLHAQVPVSTLALLGSRSATLEVCGESFDFSAQSSRTVLRFVAQLLAHANDVADGDAEVDVIPPPPIDAAATDTNEDAPPDPMSTPPLAPTEP